MVKAETVEYWDTFSVRKWWSQIAEKGLTFDTVFVAVSRDEAKEIVRYCEALLETIPIGAASAQTPLPIGGGRFPLVEAVEARLALAMSEWAAQDGGVFVKMSDRSPKDSATEGGRIERHLPVHAARCTGDDRASNASGLPAVYRAFTEAMKVTTPREAMQLMLDSFRILEDLRMRLDSIPPSNWSLDIAVRRWCPSLDISMEFRTFVFHGALTVAVQYFYDCYFPVLAEFRHEIETRLMEFWETKLKGTIKYDSCVIDVGFTGVPLSYDDHGRSVVAREAWKNDGKTFPGEPVVIELNPFDDATDGMLLDWHRHRHIIEGSDPFKLWITEAETHERKTTWWTKLLIKH